MNWYYLTLSVVACLATVSVRAQQIAPSLVWERLYENSACHFRSVIRTDDEGYILGGRIYDNGENDCIVVKVGSQGEIQWEKTYGGSGSDAISSMRRTVDGGYIFAATSSSPPSGNKESPHYGLSDIWVVKIDAAGNKLWERSYGGTGGDSVGSIWPGSEGGYIVAGSSYSAASGNKDAGGLGGPDGWLIKIDAEGGKQWDRTFGGEHSDGFTSLTQKADGGYFLAGQSYSPSSENGDAAHFGGSDAWLMKVDAEGNQQWQRFFGGTEDESFSSMDQLADGGLILGGTSSSPPSGNKASRLLGGYDYWVVKVDAASNKEWDRSFGTSSASSVESVRAVRQTTDHGYIFGGYVGGRSRLFKINSQGYQEWEQRLGAADSSHIVEIDDLQETKDGGYILVGSFDYPAAEPVPFACNWGAWAAKFETILSRAGEVVTWPADDGVVLESVDDLNGEWEADQSEVRRIGDANTIAFTPSGESRYYRLRGTGGATDVLSFGTLLSWPASINHVLEYSSNNGAEWTAFAGEVGTIGETRYAIVPESMKEHDFRTRKVN